MSDDTGNDIAEDERLAALSGWRAVFDRILAEVRAEPDNGYSAPSARCRDETARAIELTEAAFWRAQQEGLR